MYSEIFQQLTQVGSDSMGPEVNIHSIRDLEKQIEEGTGDLIQFKRARNSLLNISTRVPPEILGSIFRWNVIPDGGFPDFGGMRKGSYNFLLVCHHWFGVASQTPELWSFWGNTLKQWSRRYRCSETAPVDLVLSRYHTTGSHIPFGGLLREAVQDRAARNTIRSVHLQSRRKDLLTSILSSLTPYGEGVWSSSIESISLRSVDVSNFFARCHFPKLWFLHLSRGIKFSSWECLGPHTTALTTLHLAIEETSRDPTTSQLLSIFASNPRLQDLALSKRAIPRDNGDGSTFRVPLHNLKRLSLSGPFHPVFQLLYRLDHPETIDEMTLVVSGCTVGDIVGTFGPYLRDYLQRDRRVRDGLGIFVNSYGQCVSIQASTPSNVEGRIRRVLATFTAMLRENLLPPAGDKLCIDFAAYTPREQVVYFGGDLSMEAVRGIVPTMPELKQLHLTSAVLSDRFLQPDPKGPLANTKLLPSLRHLHLEDIVLDDDDWSPLLPYLAHQTSGGQVISLTLSGEPAHVCKDVVKDIKGLVEEFILDLPLDEDCPFDHCLVDEDGD